ncbi:MAG: GNAT family N-acetyltransferase [Moraxella sp.]|uniref:GNAT family N-acetyltransferase n=1 Tax=Moraxella sp. TaxID=479 RepID=UPI0026DD3410|nr:GNAT family N-acetyltransferase [Moraxella sp.]MDO4451185.1 GNAT family N-acetyltransferase [Moraxella sp.]
MSLTLHNLHPFSPYFKTFKTIFLKEFPQNERLPIWFLYLSSFRSCVDFWTVLDNDEFAGFVYLVNDKQKTFVLYLAVNSAKQGKGYGSQILELIKNKKANHAIVLNIETVSDSNADNYEQRLKRQKFYLKNGYEPMPFYLDDDGQRFDVLCQNRQISQQDYQRLLAKLAFGLKNIKTVLL